MANTPRPGDGEIFYMDATSSTPFDGNWFQVVPMQGAPQVPIIVSLKAGTGTLSLEGRVSTREDAVQVASYSADTQALVTAFPQMRVRATALTAGQFTVSLGFARVIDTGA